jgi:transcriptional antiterminator RfaH
MQGFESWLPLQKTLKNWSDRKKWVEEPLFHSYVFVRIQESNRLKVLQIPGIVRFIHFSGKPAYIRDNQMETLKKIITGANKVEVTKDNLAVGESVEITGGPFAGTSGEIVAHKDRKLFVIRLAEINYNLLMDIEPGLIRKLAK